MFIIIYTWIKFSINLHISTDIAAGQQKKKKGKTAFPARKSQKIIKFKVLQNNKLWSHRNAIVNVLLFRAWYTCFYNFQEPWKRINI